MDTIYLIFIIQILIIILMLTFDQFKFTSKINSNPKSKKNEKSNSKNKDRLARLECKIDLDQKPIFKFGYVDTKKKVSSLVGHKKQEKE